MPRSEIQKQRRKLNTVRRAHKGDPVIETFTKTIRSLLQLIDKGDKRPEVVTMLKQQMVGLEHAMKKKLN